MVRQMTHDVLPVVILTHVMKRFDGFGAGFFKNDMSILWQRHDTINDHDQAAIAAIISFLH